MSKLPKFTSKQKEADYWMKNDTAAFWDTFEDIKEPIEVIPNLIVEIKARHERAKAISIRLYPSQLRVAKAIAKKNHIPYQTILRNLIDQGLSHLAPERVSK